MNPLSKGSIWRIWDLQVQTILDDNYISLNDYYQDLKNTDSNKWNEFVAKVGGEQNALQYDSKQYFQDTSIAKDQRCINYVRNFIAFVETYHPELACIGLTDHNYFDDQLLDIFIQFSKDSKLKIIGGVEVNIGGVHLLAYFPKALYGKESFSDGIHAFLHKIKIDNRSNGSALTVSTEDITKVIDEVKGQKGVIVFAHCNSDNGLFQERGKTDRTNLANIFNHQPINILQSKKNSSCEVVKNYINSNDNLSSVFCLTIASDSRSLKNIGTPDEEGNYLWIKADPTFEGLKQILYEPRERVKIQQTNPFGDRQKIYINSLEFTGRTNFLIPNIKIPLNRELITIIGGRGSGKSALLESIAFLNEEHGKEDQNKKKKIIHHFRTNEDGKDPAPDFSLTVDLIDKDGNSDEHKKGLHEEEDLRLPFLYIGQEQLSIKATDDKDLTKTICKVLNIDPADIQNNKIIDNSRSVLSEINIAESELNDLLDKYSGFQNGNFTTWLDDQLLKRENQKKKISSQSTKDLLGDIDKANEKRQKLNDLYIELDHLKTSIESIDINDQIKEVNNDLQPYYTEEDAIPLIETNKQLQAINKLLLKIENGIKEVDKTINEKKNALTKLGLKEDVSVLLRSAESLQQEIGIFTRDKKRYEDLAKILEEQKNKRNEIYNSVANYLLGVKKKIDDKFVEFLQSRNASSEDEKELFNSIVKGVGIEGKINFDQDKFCKDILVEYSFVDKRTIKNITELKAQIAGKDKAGKSKDITLDVLKGWINSSLEEFLTNPALKDKAGFLEYLFTKWDEFVSVNAIVKLDDVAIPKLSIGQRGTLLLKIYLSSASVKQIFIIDQPEDNLDNQFIMHELVPLIRKIKKSRQIIMSTHNANLVVNSDAEQVVVARLYPNDDYISGGIEDPRINKDIKEILEGGEEAFRSRENKYGMGKT